MSLSVSYNQNLNRGVDTAALKEVTQQIFQRAAAKTSDISNLDLTKFKRVDLGMDLYSGKVDAATARQVAITNSGVQVNLSQNAIASVNFLKSQAAQSIFKAVEGKMAPTVAEEAPKASRLTQLPGFSQLVKTAELGQDKNGSNPFYKGELLAVKKEEKTEEEALNIFA